MAVTNVNNFTISKGFDNDFVFTVKADGSTLPMAITTTGLTPDTFVASLIELSTSTVILTKPLVVLDALSGRVGLTILVAETATLVVKAGLEVDRYYPIPTYKLVLDCNTFNNGNFLAKVGEVYVD